LLRTTRDPADLKACYALALKADEVINGLRDLWEGSVELGRAGDRPPAAG
jgi:hypothetical protein